jgi:hypothetical protein
MPSGPRRPAWLWPTARAVELWPLATVTVVLGIVIVSFGWREVEMPAIVRHAAVAGLAAAMLLGLDDPARPLMNALPTQALERLLHRVVVLAVAAGIVGTLFAAASWRVDLSPSATSAEAATLVALLATGLAVFAVTAPRVDRAAEVAALSVVLWVGAAVVPRFGLPGGLVTGWLEHPWPVAACASMVAVVFVHREM